MPKIRKRRCAHSPFKLEILQPSILQVPSSPRTFQIMRTLPTSRQHYSKVSAWADISFASASPQLRLCYVQARPSFAPVAPQLRLSFASASLQFCLSFAPASPQLRPSLATSLPKLAASSSQLRPSFAPASQLLCPGLLQILDTITVLVPSQAALKHFRQGPQHM